MAIMEKIRTSIRDWLQMQPAAPYAIQIQTADDFELHAIRNRIWYRGDSDELEQLYAQSPSVADRYKFWGSRCTPGQEMRKIHTGVPGLVVRTLSEIVCSDLYGIDISHASAADIWAHCDEENGFPQLVKRAITDMLVVGDGAFKVSIDTSLSQYPIIEWIPGDRIELVKTRGRLKEIIFKSSVVSNGARYTLHEIYGRGYIDYLLYRGDQPAALIDLEETKNLARVQFDGSQMLAVYMSLRESPKWSDRGGSLFDGKTDSFDALDEAWSQWMDALRSGRSKTYIPECLIPRDPNTGALLRPNAFDNRFIAAGTNAAENSKNEIRTEQPEIAHDSYLATYITALDLALQGIVSPSTLGIDVKKLDNAEAQREKEKTTLYTRNAIIGTLQDHIPVLIETAVNAWRILHRQSLLEFDASVQFGEYANPSFESQVETVAKAKAGGIMSIEAAVEELYGDTKDDEWKAAEVRRLKEEAGIIEMEEPAVNLDGAEVIE